MLQNEIHKNARVNYPRRRVLLRDIDDLWQADLIDVQKISKINSSNNFILIVIDCFSKFAWVRPLKNKTKDSVAKAFQSILNDDGRIPLNLQTDWGKEFYNKSFKKEMQVHSINHYSTYSTKKASIVERVIRTIKGKLYKIFSLKGNFKWADGTLDEVVNDYNHTKHRTIEMCPANVNKHTKHIVMNRYNILNKPKKRKHIFSVGDVVRLSKHKASFYKGYTPNWSTELFKVIVVQNTDPLTYLLEDSRKNKILGSFYAQELQKTKNPDVYLVEKVLKKKGNKVFVKWLGLSSHENSWISNNNIL